MKHIKLDIKGKFGVVIGLVLASVALAGWAGLHGINGLDASAESLFDKDFTGMRTIADLNVQFGHVQDEAVNFTLTGEKGEGKELLERSAVIEKELTRLSKLPDLTAKQKKLMATELSVWPKFIADWKAGKFVVKGSGLEAAKNQAEIAGALDERISPLKDTMEALSTEANKSAEGGFGSTEHFAEGSRKLTIGALILAALIGLAGVAWLVRQIVPRVRRYSAFTSKVAEGDLSSRVEATGHDELAQLGDNLNSMVESLSTMSSQVLEGARAISSSASEILATANQQNAGASQQSAAINQTTTATEEIRATAEHTARTAEEVADRAQDAVSRGTEGEEAVHAIVDGMDEIRERVEGIAQDVQALSERTAQIGEITAAVNDLADQSNLLALNATIEAARAGEQGKGFAVVADEVRILAEQSKSATAQVQAILEEIDAATRAAVEAAERGTSVVEAGTELAQRAGEIITLLTGSTRESAQAAQQIVAAAREQNAGMDQIASGMRDASQAAGEFVAGTEEAQQTVQDLNRVAAELEQLAAAYKV